MERNTDGGTPIYYNTAYNLRINVDLILIWYSNEVIMIIIISIFKEENVFSIIANLPYGPRSCCDDSCAVFIRRREASACLIMLSTKQGSHWYHF